MIVQDSMGSIDFFTSNTTAVVLLSEAEIIEKQKYKNKLMKLAQVSDSRIQFTDLNKMSTV